MFANVHYNYHTNQIHFWEYKNGIKTLYKEDYSAYCFVHDKEGDYTDIFGKACKRVNFRNYKRQRDYADSRPTLEGDIQPADRFIIDRYHDKDILSDIPNLHVHFMDIETKADKGFPEASRLEDEITLITVYSSKEKKYISFGIKPYTALDDNVEYHHCKDERDLLKKYFRWHRRDFPDVITGWHSNYFDIPYILDRAELLCGETFAASFSPVKSIRLKHFGMREYEVSAIVLLDYKVLYQDYSINERSSYKLDNIAEIELGEKKLTFDGHIKDLWKTDWNRYVNYNIKDVALIIRFDEKFDFIKLTQVQAYMSKVPLNKVNSSIKKLDNYLISLLKPDKVVVPTAKRQEKVKFPGGFVAKPIRGLHKNIVSFDYTSLYPHIMFSLNLSPETFVGEITNEYSMPYKDLDFTKIDEDAQYMLNDKHVSGSKLKKFIKKNNLLLSANGLLFKSEEGIIPKVVKGMYAKRKEFKDIMLDYKVKYEETKDEKYNKLAQKYDLFQYACKITANASYGVLANENFRFFNVKFASAVTLTGQKLTKFTIESFNTFFEKKFGVAPNTSVIYGDTDSVYVDYTPFLKKFKVKDDNLINAINIFNKQKVEPFIEKFCKKFSTEYINNEINWYHLKREAISKTGVWTDKKRYALMVLDMEYNVYKEPKLKVTGMDTVRSTTPKYCRDNIEKIIIMILNEAKKTDVISVVRGNHKEFKSQKVEDIATTTGLKDIEKNQEDVNELMDSTKLQELFDAIDSSKSNDSITYSKGCPMHVRAGILYNNLILKNKLETKYDLIYSGDKIKYIYISPKNNTIPTENVIGFPSGDIPKEFDLHQYIDYETQFEKSFMSPIQTISEAIGWGRLNIQIADMDDLF